MEYFVIEKGSATIETTIVTPILMVIIVSFILLLISTFSYSATIMEQLEDAILKEEDVYVSKDIRLLTASFKKSLTYQVVSVKSSSVQNGVEYLIYLSEEYQDVLKE